MPDPALEAHGVGMVFNAGTAKAVPAFQDISFTLAPGETLAIVGPSGCGRTTLFNVIAGLLRPSTGSVSVARRRVGHAGAMPATSGSAATRATLSP